MSHNSRVAFAINSLLGETLETAKEQKTLSLVFRKDKIAALFFTTQSEVFAQGQAFSSALDDFAVIAIGSTKGGAPRAPVLCQSGEEEKRPWLLVVSSDFKMSVVSLKEGHMWERERILSQNLRPADASGLGWLKWFLGMLHLHSNGVCGLLTT